MKTKFIAFLSLLLVFTLTAAPVYADDYDPAGIVSNQPSNVADGPYTITKTAHVLHKQSLAEGIFIVVMFEPFVSLQEGDRAVQMQSLPHYAPGMEIVDADGKALKTELVPGQEVNITFTYQMRGYVNLSGRNMEILSCEKIQLVGKTLKYGKHVEMEKDWFIGTVLQTVENNKWITVYVEGTYVYDGSSEFIAYGNTRFEINSRTKFFDKNGKAMPLDSLKPYQRVEVISDSESGMWMDSSPPKYGGGVAKEIRVLEYGNKWVPNDGNTRSITMVVEEQRITNGAVTSLIVQPLSGELRYYLPKAELFYPSGQGVDFSAYTRGTIINVTYMAVDNTAEIPAYYYITKVRRESHKMTEYQLSGVFGKEGDVELRVDSKNVDPSAKKIEATWINNSQMWINFGSGYWLEVNENGKWSRYTKAGYKGDAVSDEEMLLNAGSERKFSYNVRVWTDKLEKGTYRIAASFVADASYLITSNEFTVK